MGDYRVGKRSIGRRIFGRPFIELESTVGTGLRYNTFKVEHELYGKKAKYNVPLEIWSTCGWEIRNDDMPKVYYKDCEIAIIVCDMTNRQTFENIKLWLDKLLKNTTDQDKSRRQIAIGIVGNKNDLQGKQVSFCELSQFCKSYEDNKYFQIGHNGTDYYIKSEKIFSGYMRKYGVDDIPIEIYQLLFEFYSLKKCTIKPFLTSAKNDDGIKYLIKSLIKITLDIRQYPAFKVEECRTNSTKSRLWGMYDYLSTVVSNYV